MEKCWAAALGDCSSVESGEQKVGEKSLKRQVIQNRAFQWKDGETIQYTADTIASITSIASNNLCTTHNNTLSFLDTEAVKVIDTLSELRRVEEVRSKLKKQQTWRVLRSQINGKLLERWAAKLVMEMFWLAGKEDANWEINKTGKLQPPGQIVEAVYGKIPFQRHLGLYFVVNRGENLRFLDEILVSPLFYENSGLIGATLEFKGIKFLVWLHTNSPYNSYIIDMLGVEKEKDLLYHPTEFKFTINKALSQAIEFKW